MFSEVFKSIVYDAINSAYSGGFMPWQFKHTTNRYWTLESGIEATKWHIEKNLNGQSQILNKTCLETSLAKMVKWNVTDMLWKIL